MEQVTPVTTVVRSRIPWTMAALCGVALLAIAAVGAFASSADRSAAGGVPLQNVPAAAAASADPSASPKPSGDVEKERIWLAGPDDVGGIAGLKVHGPGIGGRISITGINGSQLSLATDNGWTRTIDASGATVHRGEAEVALSTLAVGDQILFREVRQADGTFTITDIVVLAPSVAGTITALDATSVTVRLPDGTTTTIQTTASTAYRLGRETTTRDGLVVGHELHAIGTRSGGTFTATTIQIIPAVLGGTVTAKTSDTITVTDPAGDSATIRVTTSTTYKIRGDDTPSLDDIAVGDVVVAQGTRNADGSLTATVVGEGRLKIGPGGHDGFGGKGHRGPRSGADGANPKGIPAPSVSAGGGTS